MGETKTIVLGGGCFWCTEAVFQRVEGVVGVTPGYAGGTTLNPTYDQVAAGTTGHAEVVLVEYNPDKVSLEELLHIFFATHNPTTLNMQGADIGTQYRSIIMYTDPADVPPIQDVLVKIRTDYRDDIVTALEPLGKFYTAEDYHFDYYNTNSHTPYCQFVINPKLDKLEAYLSESVEES